jgi:hypothetical protein
MPVLPAVPSTIVPPGLILDVEVSVARRIVWRYDARSLCFRILDEPEGGAVFHATTWVLELRLAIDVETRLFRETLEVDLSRAERGVQVE